MHSMYNFNLKLQNFDRFELEKVQNKEENFFWHSILEEPLMNPINILTIGLILLIREKLLNRQEKISSDKFSYKSLSRLYSLL